MTPREPVGPRGALPYARVAPMLLLSVALAGCSIPSWVPLVGRARPDPGPLPAPAPAGAPLEVPSRVSLEPDEVLDRVICVVNNDAITLYELDEAEAYYLYETREEPQEGEARRALRERLLRRLIESRLELQQAEREKIVVEDAEVSERLTEFMRQLKVEGEAELREALKLHGLTIEGARKRLRDQLMVQKIIRRKVALRVSVTEQEIDRYVQQNRDKLETGLTFEASHILLLPKGGGTEAGWTGARQRADEAYARLLAGEPFVEVARKYSEDGSAKDGGSLGSLKRGELAAEIEAAILALRPGDYSRPFRSTLGFHIFKLTARESLTGEGLAQARAQIRDILYREKYQARMDEWLAELKGRAVIDIRL